MENCRLRILLFLVFFIFSASITAQNIKIYTLSESIIIAKDTTFTKDISVFLKKSHEEIVYPVFYDKELEEISDINVYIKKGKRFKREKNWDIPENDVKLDYITSKKVKLIIIPPELEAKITYTVKCKELMYFSNLFFFSYNDTDTLKYHIKIPETFRLSYDILNKDSLNYLTIDSLIADTMCTWYVEVVPKKVEPDPLMYFGIYKNLKVPLMRTIVVPKAYENKEREYLNNWYLSKSESVSRLNSASTEKIDELTSGFYNPVNILDTLYKYVQTNFKYVAIEIGMGAFIPSDVNEVYINKQGDCKDLSNYLSEALKHKGIKSHIALAATYNHISNCDFPSLVSANHVICVAYINGEPILLDPTDPIHSLKSPVQSLQERTILIINSTGGEYYKLESSPSEQNAISYEIELKVDSSHMNMAGDFKVVYKGISGNFLKRALMNLSINEMNKLGEKHYRAIFSNQLISYFNIYNDEKYIKSEGKLSVKGKIFKLGDDRYLFIDFLPRLIETEDRGTLLEGMYIGNTIEKKVKLRIITDKPFEAFSPINHTFSEDGIILNITITKPAERVIECNYEFLLDHIFIKKDNLDNINHILESFKKIINEPVILKKQR